MASRIEQYLLTVIGDPPRPGPAAALLRGALGGCAALCDLGLEIYLAGECLGLRRREKLPLPTISIGNLTVGGTGKTPMTQMLCRRLLEQGKRTAVLSRGHGGQGIAVRVVSNPEGRLLLGADEAGDEPALLARTLPGIPIVVGKDRRLSGREAMRRWPLDVLVLDDGFQFWQLARELDIVLLDARRPFDNGSPLPRGLLREPKRHLRRAGMVVVTRTERLDEVARVALREQIFALSPLADVYFARHKAIGLVSLSEKTLLPLATLQNRRVVALSGIAQPESFLQTLQAATGAQIAHSLVFSDHHFYTEADARRVEGLVRDCGAEALVMTEKDAVKWPANGDSNAAYALRIEMAVEEETRFLEAVRKVIEAR